MIDTLSIAADLAAAGIEKPHAEAHARVIANAVEQRNGEAASKDFVEAKISAVEAKISAVEARLVRWIVGAVFTAAGLLFAALRFIP